MDTIDVQSIVEVCFQHLDGMTIKTIKNVCADLALAYEEKYKRQLYVRLTRWEWYYMAHRWPDIFVIDDNNCRVNRNYMPTREEAETIFYSGFGGSNDYSKQVLDILENFNWGKYRGKSGCL